MKKYVICFMLLACFGCAVAQDVVHYGDYPRYLFNFRRPKLVANPLPYQTTCYYFYNGCGHFIGCSRLIKFHSPDSIFVYGVAVAYSDSSRGIFNADHWHLQATLGKRIDGELCLLDTSDRENGLRLFGRYNHSWYGEEDTCEVGDTNLVEIYFDEPTYVCDSFYVGIDNDAPVVQNVPTIYQPQGIYIMSESEDSDRVITVNDPRFTGWGHDDVYDHALYCIFPIVAPPCYAPEAPEADSLDRGVFVLRWDNLCDTVQVSVAPDTVAPEQGMLFTLSDTTSLLLDLGAGRRCLARLRCRCPQVEGVWSPWSEPVVLYHDTVSAGGDEPGPEPGTGVTTAGAVLWTLTPNPATGRVRVSCGEAMRKVEVYDMQGRRCLAQEVQGSETVLDISALAAGRYTVLLHTATATAARPLIVQ